MRKTHLWVIALAVCPLAGIAVWFASPSRAQSNAKQPPPPVAEQPRSRLPLTQVVLFNTGVGYFRREGDVEGDARVDLFFPSSDINDLLRSLIIEDGGKLASVGYDSREPIERTLKSFAVDLNGNPTLGQVLNQARGEKVEVTVESTPGGNAAPLSGTILGMEAETANGTETHHLNVLTSDGLRRLPLARVIRVRFLNPMLEQELRLALGHVAAGNNEQRRTFSLNLRGEGKRTVKVGYIVESSIWKPSYRLVLGEKKNRLLGWAVIENTTDEDWKDVRMVLVSGRPISYEMDLAQPLFLPRPPLEHEVYASLRPPTHAGGTPAPGSAGQLGGVQLGGMQLGGMQLGGMQLGGAQLGSGGQLGGVNPGGGFGGIQIGLSPMWGLDTTSLLMAAQGTLRNRYQIPTQQSVPPRRVSYAELLERRKQQLEAKQAARDEASQMGRSIVEGNPDAIDEFAADADRVGEEFRLTLDKKVTLPRHRAALLPVQDSPVTVRRLSIYNRKIHPFFPLRGARVKNTTGQHLQQGPVSVFDEGSYLGDARLPALQPDQEKFVTFSMDLGVEVRGRPTSWETRNSWVRIANGRLSGTEIHTGTTTYAIRNRSKTDRTLIIEQPITEGHELVTPERFSEKTTDLYRFEWPILPGKTEKRTVVEQRTLLVAQPLKSLTLQDLNHRIADPGTPQSLTDALVVVRTKMEFIQSCKANRTRIALQVAEAVRKRDELSAEIRKIPKETMAIKKALEKFDLLSQDLERRRTALEEADLAETKAQFEYERHIASLQVK